MIMYIITAIALTYLCKRQLDADKNIWNTHSNVMTLLCRIRELENKVAKLEKNKQGD